VGEQALIREHGDVWEQRLEEVATAYVDAVEAGQTPDRQEWLTRHPDLAGELSTFFADLDAVQSWTEPFRAAAEAARDARLGRFGDYELLAEIGRGGMGVVYRARQVRLERLVALKMIRRDRLDRDPERVRFHNEARLVADLDHPNIVPIYEVGEAEGQTYFTMKLIAGGSALDRAEQFGAAPSRAARLVATVARAVHHAHQRGILHRDLKPANILLDREGAPHVTDFGLAKRVAADSDLSQSAPLLGTPTSMAPEQTYPDHKAITTATDVYGLGAILYALLTGRPPFRGGDVLETLRLVREQTPEPPQRINPRVDRDLGTICLKCLEKEPAQRYPSAEALAEDLERWQAGEPIQARPVGRAERVWRWCRRNSVVTGLAAAAALALMAGTGVSAYFAVQANSRARDAERQRDAVQKEKERADKNLALARTATDDLSAKISDNPRLRQHDLEGLRKELLQSAVRIYQQLVQLQGGDEHLLRDQGRALGRLARMTFEIQSEAEALPLYLQALEIFENLTRDYPEVPEYQRYLAITHLNLGHVYGALRRASDAEHSYREAQRIWENLSRAYPADRGHQSNLAMVHGALADLYGDTDRPTLAEKAYRKTLEIGQALAEAEPGDPYRQNILAMYYNNFGAFCREMDRQEEAARLYEEAFKIRERLARAYPTELEPQVNLAMSYHNLGNLYGALDRLHDAEDSYHKALDIKEKLAHTHPLVAEYQDALAETYENLGSLYHDTGQLTRAEGFYLKALAIWKELARTHGSAPRHGINLGEITGNLGGLELAKNRPRPALDWFDQSVATLQAVLQQDRGNSEARKHLSHACDGRGQALMRLGRPGEARQSWAQALDLAPDRARARLRLAAARTLAQMGKHAEATAEARALAAKAPGGEALLYQAACVHAHALAAVRNDAKLPQAEREQCADRYAAGAVELLREAQAAGYFKTSAEVRHLKKDRDLDALRARDDFGKLLQELGN
jgi:serine/threonine-protein kinase